MLKSISSYSYDIFFKVHLFCLCACAGDPHARLPLSLICNLLVCRCMQSIGNEFIETHFCHTKAPRARKNSSLSSATSPPFLEKLLSTLRSMHTYRVTVAASRNVLPIRLCSFLMQYLVHCVLWPSSRSVRSDEVTSGLEA